MTTTPSRLRDDERGLSPFVLLAGVVAFAIVSVGLIAGLVASMQVSATMQVNAQVAEAAGAAAREPVRQGFDAAKGQPATSTLQFDIGAFTATATRTIEVNTASRAARITVAVGKFNGSEFADPATCSTAPANCIIVTEMVAGGPA